MRSLLPASRTQLLIDLMQPIKPRDLLQLAAGLTLCLVAYFLAHRESYEVRTILASAGGCQMATDIYEPRSGTPLGSVVLFHGLAANKKVMAFNAQEFANQDLRVFVPDLPGHGRTPGPFSPDRDDSCALALVRDLAARKAILPERTLLAGHSLGGAIAIRAAAHFPVSGIIAISPAPMHVAPGFSEEMIPFHDAPPLPAHSLVLSGQWEPGPIQSLAQQLVSSASDSTSQYNMIPGTTHVSILFSSQTFSELRSWSSQLLGTSADSPFPKNMPALACLLGLAGLSIMAPPFLREMNAPAKSAPCPPTPHPAPAPCHSERSDRRFRLGRKEPAFSWSSTARNAALLLAASLLATLLLASGYTPFRFVRVFQGGFLGVFLFLTGGLALAARRKLVGPELRSASLPVLASAAASALVLVLLYAAWFELTFYEAWLNPARWLRFPVLFLLMLPWHFAEELFLGDSPRSPNRLRLLKALLFRALAYASLLLGVLVLRSGEILLFLLLAYFVIFSILQRLACDLVRFRTRSPMAAAIFGAILLAAFALAIFPIA